MSHLRFEKFLAISAAALAVAFLLPHLPLARAQSAVDGGAIKAATAASLSAVDAGTPQYAPDLAPIVTATDVPSVSALQKFGADLMAAAHSPSKALIIVLILIALVAMLRIWGAPAANAVGLKSFATFITSDRGGAITTLVIATLGGIGTSLMAGQALSFGLFALAIGIGLKAIGGYVGIRKIFGISSAPTTAVQTPSLQAAK